jgi:hypothetical protein
MRGFSLFLIAAGAILTFAVNVLVEGVDLRMVGVILMVVGAIGLIFGLVRGSATRVSRQVSADGREVVEDRRTTGV